MTIPLDTKKLLDSLDKEYFRRKVAQLPTMAEVQAMRRAPQKSLRVGSKVSVAINKHTPIKKKRPEVDAAERRCRAAVWKRDQGRSRASGLKVEKGHDNELIRGEVAHLASRSHEPAKKWDSSNCVLLTAEEHRLSDRRTAPAGKILLKIRGTDARKTLTFTRLDGDGQVLWSRKSAPPPKVAP